MGGLDAEGVGGDALVDSVGLAIDAVRVAPGQDGDAVPGAAGYLGRGHPFTGNERASQVTQKGEDAGSDLDNETPRAWHRTPSVQRKRQAYSRGVQARR